MRQSEMNQFANTREARGVSLERSFAEWMRSNLGYTKTKLRIPVKGRIADRAYEVDIHGEKYSTVWDLSQRVGLAGFLLALLVAILPTQFRGVHRWMEEMVASYVPELAGSALAVFFFGGLVLSIYGKKKAMRHAWVECKDTKRNVKRAHVQKLSASVKDITDNEDAKWYPDVVILVSGSDFDEDALNFARENRFVCYRRTSSGFERVE